MNVDVKICGLKTDEAIAAALDGGASHVGFIFFEKSPRNVSPIEAGHLRQAARGRARAVAVTVDADDTALDRIVETAEPDMLQLHGKEAPERVAAIKARYGLPIMKSVAIRVADDLAALTAYAGIPDRFLLDAKAPPGSALPGGNGRAFDWTLLEGLDPSVDYLLSGGLNAGNLADALRIARPRGIDVSSGVERAPGVKDPERIRAFFAALAALRETHPA